MSIGGNQNLGTATFYIVGDASGAQTAADKTNAALASLSGGIQQNLFGLNQLGLAFSVLPAAASAGFGLAVNAAIDFETAMTDVARAADRIGDGEFMSGMRNQILDIARVTPLATTEIAELVAIGAQLGVEGSDGLGKFAETMSALLTTTNLTKASVGDFARLANVMGVSADGFERMGNVVLELGRNTAATETEILNMARRVSGAANAAGFTADQVLSLSAAVLSLGPRAEAGGTAMTKTINDIVVATAEGSSELEVFADIAGKSADQFSQAWGQDAASALGDFLAGLGRLDAQGQILALRELGITEARQIQALQQLAAGTLDAGNSAKDYNQILEDGLDAQLNSNALMEAQEARSKTLAGQIDVLKNIMFEFGVGLGQLGAGPISFFVKLLGDTLVGFLNLSPGVRIAALALAGLMAVVSAIGAALFILVPRILLAVQAYRELGFGAASSASGLAASTAALNANAAAAGRAATAAATAAVSQSSLASINNSLAAAFGSFGAGVQGVGVSLVNTTQKATGFAAIVSRLPTLLRGLGIAGTVASVGLGILGFIANRTGNDVRNFEEEVNKAQEANLDLALIMRTQGAAIGENSLNWIRSTGAYAQVQKAARLLGVDLLTLEAIIQGIATDAQLEEFENALVNADKKTLQAVESVVNLTRQFQNSATAAGVGARAVGSFGDAEADAAQDAQKLNKELREQHDRILGIAQAFVDLVSAQESQHDAQQGLTDAQERYNEALERQRNHHEEIAEAEDNLISARLRHEQSMLDLEDAEADLATARQRALDLVADAEEDLADARDRLVDSGDKIAKIEEELQELRSEDNIDEIRDATLALADARLRLVSSSRKVEDAEFRLQQMREEGASARDIADAELAILEAKQQVAEAEDSIIDGEQELADLRDRSELARKIVEKERNLQRAYRDQKEAVRELQETEQKLARARSEQAADTLYRDAVRAVRQAQLDVRDAVRGIADAERELGETRSGIEIREEMQEATEGLRDAAFTLAQANSEVARQEALMRGEIWQADDAARTLAANLRTLYSTVPDPSAQQALREYADILSHVPEVPDPPQDPPDDWPHSFGLPTAPDLAGHGNLIADWVEETVNSVRDGLGKDPGDGGRKGGLFSGLAERIDKWWDDQIQYVPKQIRDFVGANVDTAQATWHQYEDWWFGDNDDGIASRLDKWWDDQIQYVPGGIRDFVGGNIETAKNLWRNVDSWLFGDDDDQEEKIDRNIENLADRAIAALRDEQPGTEAKFQGFGRDTYAALADGMDYEFSTRVSKIPGKVSSELKAKQERGSSWLLRNAGQAIMSGLRGGADDEYTGRVAPWFAARAAAVAALVGNPEGSLNPAGRGLVRGLGQGAKDEEVYQSGWWRGLGGRMRSNFEANDPHSQFWHAGQWIMEGLRRGIENAANSVMRGVQRVADDMIDTLGRKFLFGSPSKVTAQMGKWIMQGLSEGIDGGARRAIRSTEDAMTEVLNQSSEIGDRIVADTIAAMESQFTDLERTMMKFREIVMEELLGMYLDGDYVQGLINDLRTNVGADFASSSAGLSLAGVSAATPPVVQAGSNTDVFQLQAITNADPQAILNQYIWAKRVRLRGGTPVG